MRILRDHLLREFFGSFFFALATLLFIFLLGRGLVQMADLVFNKDVDVWLVIQLLAYSLPFILTFLIPMSVLVASLLSFGRLSHDNELTAIRASGVSLLRVIAPVLWVVVILSLFTLVLSDRLASTTHFAYRRLLTQIGLKAPGAAIEEGTFIKNFKNFVIFVYEVDKNKLKGIRIYQPQEGGPTRTIIAQKGEIVSVPEENLIKLKLVHGTIDEVDPKDPSKLYKASFTTYELPLNIDEIQKREELGKKPKDMTIRELQNEIKRLGVAGIKATYPLAAEIHNKIALSFSSLAFALIGIPLGITTRRGEKSIGIGIALALMTLYWTLLIGGKAIAQKGLVPPFMALQFSNFVTAAVGLVLLRRLAKN